MTAQKLTRMEKKLQKRRLEGRKEMFYLTTHSTHFVFTVILRQTYGKEPLSWGERNSAAATWATLFD